MEPQERCALLIAYAFPPLNVIGAQRALRIARVLLERFDRVYVAGLDFRRLDPALLDFEYGEDMLDEPRLTFIASTPLNGGFEFTASTSLVQRIGGGIVGRLLCGRGLGWMPRLARSLEDIPESADVRLVLATGYPFITFLTAVKWAKRRAAAVVLDYRDLWTRNPRASHPALARYWVRKLIERPVNAAATLITTVSEGCRQIIEQDASDTPVRVLLNAPDERYIAYYENIARQAPRQQREEGGPVRIVFTGQVYPECTFAPFLDALAALPEARRNRVEVHYYGGCSKDVTREFAQRGLGDRLVDHGFVSKEKSIEAILQADALLSLIHTDSVATDPAVTGLMTTKVYDYLLSGNPVVSIGPVNAEVNAFARTIAHPRFHAFTAKQTAALSGFLDALVEASGRGTPDRQTVVMPGFAAQLHAIIQSLDGTPGAAGLPCEDARP